MNKVFAAFLALLLAFPLAAQPVNLVQEATQSVVALATAQGRYFCSGFVIKSGYVQTAYHCLVNDYGKVYVNGFDSKVAYADQVLDLAILAVKTGNLKALHPAKDPQPDMKLFALGHPVGFKNLSIMEGTLLAIHPMGYISSGMAVPGMSGGPVVSERGEVVAINQLISRGTDLVMDYGVKVSIMLQHELKFWEHR